MEVFEIYKFLHVSAAIVWVGGGIFGAILTRRALSAPPEHTLGIARDMDHVSKRLFVPAALATLLFGILMVVDAEPYGFGQAWIIIGLGGVALSIAVGAGFLGPQSEKLVEELEAGDPSAISRLETVDKVALVDLAVLLIVVWAMVAKPGLG